MDFDRRATGRGEGGLSLEVKMRMTPIVARPDAVAS